MSTVAPFARAWKSPANSAFVYVDSVAGDDLRGLGTQDFPFQTLNKAYAYAKANGKSGIVARGYFSENMSTPSGSVPVYSDYFGDFIFDGQKVYQTMSLSFGGSAIIIQTVNGVNAASNSVFVDSLGNFSSINRSAVKKVKGNPVMYGFTNSSFKDVMFGRSYGNYTASNNIFDGCRVFLDVSGAYTFTFNTCLFRANCQFWVKKPDNSGDMRLDSDGMTASQKEALIQDWLLNGQVASGYSKVVMTRCRFTDNRIFNLPDDDDTDTNYDFSLIYGTEADQPACYMDAGKYIGAFPPAIKIEFKNTADLTTSPYEIEVKDTDNIVVSSSGSVSLGPNFTGATLYSKPMPIPMGTIFNGFNLSLFPDTNSNGVYLTHRNDSVDLSDTNKLDLSTPTTLETGKCYLVKADLNSAAVYKGVAYGNNQVLMADDDITQAERSGSGNVYLYAMKHPSIWSNVQVKVCESGTLPSDFLINDNSYPWLPAHTISIPEDPNNPNKYTGFRVLRVGNTPNGAIDIGSDGVALTNAHPEFYSSANVNRIKYSINAMWVVLRITLVKF